MGGRKGEEASVVGSAGRFGVLSCAVVCVAGVYFWLVRVEPDEAVRQQLATERVAADRSAGGPVVEDAEPPVAEVRAGVDGQGERGVDDRLARLLWEARRFFGPAVTFGQLADDHLEQVPMVAMHLFLARNKVTCDDIEKILEELNPEDPIRAGVVLCLGWAGDLRDEHRAHLMRIASVWSGAESLAAIRALDYSGSQKELDAATCEILGSGEWRGERGDLARIALSAPRECSASVARNAAVVARNPTAPEDVRRAAWLCVGSAGGVDGFREIVTAIRTGEDMALWGMDRVRGDAVKRCGNEKGGVPSC
ncbi:MAG: hypothetical protein HY812_04990 [Planctomycetes bacterium]|nr:hypothetical protein [Planctomycetota bacterium]